MLLYYYVNVMTHNVGIPQVLLVHMTGLISLNEDRHCGSKPQHNE